MRYGLIVTLVLAPLLLVKAVAYPPGDGDLFWQRWLGSTIMAAHGIPRALGPETFTAPGAAWVPQEWLFSLGLAFSAAHGARLLFYAVIGACAIAALILVMLRAERRGATPLFAAFCTGLAGIALLESFGVRVQVAAWPIIALFLLVLDEDGAWLWALVPIAALWSNVHASAMLAPVLAGAATLGVALEDRSWTVRLRRHALVTVASAVALGLNPLGYDLPRYSVVLFTSPIKHWIAEWRPTDMGDTSFVLGGLPLLCVAMVFGVVAGGRWKQGLVFGAFTLLLFTAARNIAVFSIAAAPVVADMLSRFFPAAQRSGSATPLDRAMRVVIPAFGCAMAIVVGVGIARKAPPQTRNLPVSAIAALDRMPGTHSLLCSDFAWCALELPPNGGMPRNRVFLDGRADPYPVAVWRDFINIVRLEPGWSAQLVAYNVDAVLVKNDAPLSQALGLTSGWRVAYADEAFKLYLRTGDGAQSGRSHASRHGTGGGVHRSSTRRLARRLETAQPLAVGSG
jgi:hypothetical protein